MITKKNIQITKGQEISIYNPNGTKGIIIYYHGGGLIYGNKDDLPMKYIDQFTNSGYTFVSANYLLAPESNYSDILNSVYNSYKWLISNLTLLTKSKKVIIFGRSAGAYLCYQIIMNKSIKRIPDAFIDFYGFFDILDKKIAQPDNFYEKYPDIDVQSLIGTHQIYYGDIEKRFPIYLSARKNGTWIKILNISTNEQLNINFSQMPPTFIVHATNDSDVPFSIALNEKSKNKHAVLKSINSNQHDFDRIPSESNLTLYKNVIEWLSSL